MTTRPRLILLNGSSSSGKTTLAHKLQQLLDEPFQHIALDQFRDGMPGRFRGFNSPPESPGGRGLNIVPLDTTEGRLTHIRFGEHGEQMLRGMRRAIAAFAAVGNNVIIDDLLFKRDYLLDYVEALSGLDTWFIGVRCQRDVVQDRETRRPGRFPGTALSHFHQVHAHGAPYDLEVDTSATRPRACAQAIVERLSQPPEVFPCLAATLQRAREFTAAKG
ncbi:MAG: AAA family ATPase [Pseudomonadales bacterium]